MTPQQQLFAIRMDQMRKDAKKKNKIQFARVRKNNELYLAEHEERLHIQTYKRLHEYGTMKIQDQRFGTYMRG